MSSSKYSINYVRSRNYACGHVKTEHRANAGTREGQHINNSLDVIFPHAHSGACAMLFDLTCRTKVISNTYSPARKMQSCVQIVFKLPLWLAKRFRDTMLVLLWGWGSACAACYVHVILRLMRAQHSRAPCAVSHHKTYQPTHCNELVAHQPCVAPLC